MRISAWAGLHNRQAELDFVDIDTDEDTRLFVDPYAIDIRDDAWSAQCSLHLRSFFNALITALRRGEEARAAHLCSHLHEAGETFLGMSRGHPQGRGIGRDQASQLVEALRRSRAVETGLLSELAETELFIEGIGSDKISDLTINVIRGPLLSYTAEQARLWGMPLTQNVALDPVWDPNREDWVQAPRETIVVAGQPVLLVPKYSVRRILTLNSQEFYNHSMLGYLQREYLNAGQGLVKVLKSGDEVLRPFPKTDLKEMHPKSKPYLAEFAQQHPEVLKQYKEIAGAKGTLEPEDFDREFDEYAYARELAARLPDIATGNADASRYHSYCIGVLTFLFFPFLISPIKEHEIDQGRKRIDITYTNSATDGFFFTALQSAQTRAIWVPVECKNYTKDVANPELDQIEGRFSLVRGNLGMLCCRAFENRELFVQRCRDAALHRGHYVLAFCDDDLLQMLRNVAEGRRAENDALLRRRYGELIA